MLKHVIARYPRAYRLVNRLRAPYPVYWMEDLQNFGDDIGPWLLTMMTGRRVRNVRRKNPPLEPGLMTVGSLIQKIDRPGMAIWGSGLIRPVTSGLRRKLSEHPPTEIYAVRGRLTQEELTTKLGWSTPHVFGDPAALLPIYYQPRPKSGRSTSIVPHYIHKQYFNDLECDKVSVIDVQQHPAEVIDEIANSKVIISTSLHGIICAQAYQVPWVWLQIPSEDVRGGAFKFEDFFTNLDRESVSHVQVQPEDICRQFVERIVQTAALPKERTNYQALHDSLPV